MIREAAPLQEQPRGNTPTRSSPAESFIFAGIIAAFCLYAAVFISRTSFVIDGERYFSLQDDGMISMRYARNLAHGYGLVWNPGGPRVEGYTNFLWVLYMALLHGVPLAASKMSLLVQISGAVLLVANLFVVRQIAARLSGGSPIAMTGTVLITAFYYPLVNWSLQGMEVSLLALLVSVCTLLAVTSLQAQTVSWPMYLLLAVATLVRPDAAVIFLAFLGFFLVTDPTRRKRHLLTGGGLLLAFLGGMTAFRLAYFGDIFPNTYYLKMTGYPVLARMTRGLFVLWQFAWWCRLTVLFVPLYLLSRRRDPAILLLITVFTTQILYSVYVGGDAWEWWRGSNRYITIVMPLFFLLFGCTLNAVFDQIRRKRAIPIFASKRRLNLFAAAAIVFCLLITNGFNGSPRSMQQWALLTRPPDVSGAVNGNVNIVRMARVLNEITTRQATVAVTWAGAMPYYTSRNYVDLLGKMDRVIAHEPMRVPTGLAKYIAFHPGHLKWDYRYSIGVLKPDVVAQLWGVRPEDALPYLHEYTAVDLHGYTFYLRRGSHHIFWNTIAANHGEGHS